MSPPSIAIISQPRRNATKQLPIIARVLRVDCRSFDLHIAFGVKSYAVLKPLNHKVGQLLYRSAAVITGDGLPR